ACQERQDQRIQLVRATDVLDVGIDLIAQAEVQCELTMHAPIVLKKRGDVSVVCVRQDQRAIRNSTAERHCKQEIVIVDATVAVAIEVGKVFDQLDAALLKYFQIQIRLD